MSTFNHTCARGHEWVSINADSTCYQCQEIDTAIAKGRPQCAADGCTDLVTASDKAFEAGQRFCRGHAYGNFMGEQESKFAPLLDPFRERGYQAEVLQTGGFVMLPIVWLDGEGKKAIGISHEASDTWSTITYLDYNESDEWCDPTGIPMDIDNGDHDTLLNVERIVAEVMSYIDDGRLQADLMRLGRENERVYQLDITTSNPDIVTRIKKAFDIVGLDVSESGDHHHLEAGLFGVNRYSGKPEGLLWGTEYDPDEAGFDEPDTTTDSQEG